MEVNYWLTCLGSKRNDKNKNLCTLYPGDLTHTFFFLDYWTTQSWDQPSLQSSQSMYLFFLDKLSLSCKLILACPRSPFLPQCRSSSYISHPSEQYPHLPNHPSRHLGVILESSFKLHFSHSTHHSSLVDLISSSSLKIILSSSFPTLLIWVQP